MDVRFLEFYQRELRALNEDALTFAKENPELANQLQLCSHNADPYVERIIQSVAYLTAGIHRQIDANHTNYQQSLAALYFPYLQYAPPGLLVLQCQADNLTLPNATKWQISTNEGPIHFQSTFALTIIDTKVTTDVLPSRDGLRLCMRKIPRRLFINATPDIGATLLWFIGQNCKSLTLNGRDLPSSAVRQFMPRCLLPTEKQTITSQQRFYESLCYPVIQQFIDLDLPDLEDAELIIRFHEPLPSHLGLSHDIFLPNCVPLLNCFASASEPMTMTDQHSAPLIFEYPYDEAKYELIAIKHLATLPESVKIYEQTDSYPLNRPVITWQRQFYPADYLQFFFHGTHDATSYTAFAELMLANKFLPYINPEQLKLSEHLIENLLSSVVTMPTPSHQTADTQTLAKHLLGFLQFAPSQIDKVILHAFLSRFCFLGRYVTDFVEAIEKVDRTSAVSRVYLAHAHAVMNYTNINIILSSSYFLPSYALQKSLFTLLESFLSIGEGLRIGFRSTCGRYQSEFMSEALCQTAS